MTEERLLEMERVAIWGCPGVREENWAPVRAMLHESIDAIRALQTRQEELLQTLVKVTRETPYAEEVEQNRSHVRALVAEVGTLKSQVRANIDAMNEAVDWIRRFQAAASGICSAHCEPEPECSVCYPGRPR